MRNITRQISLEFLHKIIGTPYEKADCWEVVKFFYKNAFNVDLSQYDQESENPESVARYINFNKKNLIETKDPRVGDIILFRMLGHNAHVGVYLDNRRFLHSVERIGCAIDLMHNWEKRIQGIYRWPDFA